MTLQQELGIKTYSYSLYDIVKFLDDMQKASINEAQNVVEHTKVPLEVIYLTMFDHASLKNTEGLSINSFINYLDNSKYSRTAKNLYYSYFINSKYKAIITESDHLILKNIILNNDLDFLKLIPIKTLQTLQIEELGDTYNPFIALIRPDYNTVKYLLENGVSTSNVYTDEFNEKKISALEYIKSGNRKYDDPRILKLIEKYSK